MPFNTCLFRGIVVLASSFAFTVDPVEGECSDTVMVNCFFPAYAKYANRISAYDFAFNRAQLSDLCSDISTVTQCVAKEGCQLDNTGLLAIWRSFTTLASNICNNGSELQTEYLRHEPCYESVDLRTAVVNCINAEKYATSPDNSNKCRFTVAKLRCLELALLRNCGSESTGYFKRLVYPVLESFSDCNMNTQFEGQCTEESFRNCTRELIRSQFNVAELTTFTQIFDDEYNFNDTCRFVDFISGCLDTYRCNNASLTERWTRFRTPLLELCYPLYNDTRRLYTRSSCPKSGQCSNAGPTAIFISRCPDGFMLDATRQSCNSVTSDAAEMRTILVPVLIVNTVWRILS